MKKLFLSLIALFFCISGCGQVSHNTNNTAQPLDYTSSQLNVLANLWEGLAKRTDLTEKEYLKYCYGEVEGTTILIYDNDGDVEQELTFYVPDKQLRGFRYYATLFPYHELCHNNMKIIRRLDGTDSQWYLGAVLEYFNALLIKAEQEPQNRLWLEKAHTCCTELLNSDHYKKTDNTYIEIAINDIKCLMSLGGHYTEVSKRIKELIRLSKKIDYTDLPIRLYSLWAEVALLNGNYPEAIKAQKQAWHLTGLLPNGDDNDLFMDNITNQIQEYTLVAVISQDKDMLKEAELLIPNWARESIDPSLPNREQIGMALSMLVSFNSPFPYQQNLKSQFNSKIYLLYGYQPKEYSIL